MIRKRALLIAFLAFFLIFLNLYLLSYVLRNPLVYGWLIFPIFLLALFLSKAKKIIDKKLKKYQQGAKSEEKIEKILDNLGENYYVIHDVMISKGNIDHIVIAPAGIYTIETKSHRGKITANQDELLLNGKNLSKDFLNQAIAEALTVKEYLKRISLGKADYFVQPILVFTRAFVDVGGKVKGVKVLPEKWLVPEPKKGKELIGKLERSSLAAALKEKSQTKS